MLAKIERFVSCVVLCRTGSDELEQYVRELSTVLRESTADHEIVLVNDRAEPKARAAVENILSQLPYVRALQLTQSKGDHVAATAGLETTLGDYVCVLDSANDPPALVPEAVRTALKGADVVFGIDTALAGRRALPRLLERVFGWYARRYLKLDIASGMGSFRCLNRSAVNALTRLAHAHRFYRVWGDYVGLSTVRTFYQGRGQRRSRSLIASIDEAIDIAISTSPHPLRVLSGLALLFAAANFLYVVYIVATFVLKPDVATGWTTLSLQIATVSILLLFVLAVFGEYIGRLLERASTKPAYWVLEERTSKQFAQSDVERRNVVTQSNSDERDYVASNAPR